MRERGGGLFFACVCVFVCFCRYTFFFFFEQGLVDIFFFSFFFFSPRREFLLDAATMTKTK